MRKTLLFNIHKNVRAAISLLVVLLNYPGFHAIVLYRISHFIWNLHLKTIAKFISNISRLFTGIEIHPAATIGKRLFIDHGYGVVIGETTIIGDDCTIYQNVTLGSKNCIHACSQRHPTLKNHVTVYAGAKIIGNVVINDNSIIGASAVVLNDVEKNSVVVGVPAKSIR